MQERFFLGQSPLGFHRIAYTQYGEPNDRPPVVCLHGMTRNSTDFEALALALVEKGRTVYCPDLVGRGKSDWLKNPALYNIPQYLSDCTAMIARTGAPQMDWVGTSFGGSVSMMLAAQPNTPVRRLVLNDGGPFLPYAALQRIATYTSKAPVFENILDAERYFRQVYAPCGTLSDADWTKMTKNSIRRLPNAQFTVLHDPRLSQWLGSVPTDVDVWSFYDVIKAPTLLVRGAHSDMLPADVADAMTQRGPKAKLITFPDCGHAPWPSRPDFIKAVLDFLE